MFRKNALLLLGCGLLILLMPGGDSFWIDEAFSGLYSKQPSFSTFVQYFLAHPGTEMKTPLHVLWAWCAGRYAGSNEWLLRLSNVPWVCLATWLCYRIGKRVKAPLTAVIFCLSPFVWFYANEFRPYSMQIAGGAAWLWCCLRLIQGEIAEKSLSFYLSALFLSTSSMLGLLPLGVMLTVTCGLLLHQKELSFTRLLSIYLWLGLALLPVVAYYLWAIIIGQFGGGGSWTASWKNIFFVFYEFLGFSGLGPGRLALRTAVQNEGQLGDLFTWWQVTSFALLSLIYSILAWQGIHCILRLSGSLQHDNNTRPEPIYLRLCGFSVAGCILLLFLLVYALGWPFWGRHLAPLFPAVVTIISIVLKTIEPTYVRRTTTGLLVVLLAAGSLLFRFSNIHKRDNYREASASALIALHHSDVVWWAAAKQGADFYHLPTPTEYNEYNSGNIAVLVNPKKMELTQLPKPNRVYLSRVDIFDKFGSIQEYLKQHSFVVTEEFTGFTVWERAGR